MRIIGVECIILVLMNVQYKINGDVNEEKVECKN